MADVIIEKVNESFIRCICDSGIAYQLRDHFTFEIPNAVHVIRMMKKKGRHGFDGKIRLYNVLTGQILFGLLPNITDFCDANKLTYSIPDDLADYEFSDIEAKQFIQTLNLPFEVRDFQLKAFIDGVRGSRRLFVSPTGSGKSLMIYLLFRFYGMKALVIVPTVDLTNQMVEHFKGYGYKDEIHTISTGKDKQSNAAITISTWQSLYKEDESYFEQYDVVFGDEAHGIEAKSSQAMFAKMKKMQFRFGFTATIKETTTNPLVLQGIFGKIIELEKTANLIDKKTLAGLEIKILILKYPKQECKYVSTLNYQDETTYIITHPRRNKYICNLVDILKGTTLVSFRRIEDQGDLLYKILEKNSNKKLFYLHGGVEGEQRNELRRIIETENDATILGSMGVFSTGNDVYNIHNILLGAPVKGSVKLKQLIGRGLRRSAEKQHLTFYDIVDDMTYNDSPNYALLHYINRVKIYAEEGFQYKVYTINFEEKKEKVVNK